MIEIGKEYVFSFRIDNNCACDDDIELCINNDGLNCRVIEYKGADEYGNLYEVESCTGSEFFAYESELDELKDERLRWWV